MLAEICYWNFFSYCQNVLSLYLKKNVDGPDFRQNLEHSINDLEIVVINNT